MTSASRGQYDLRVAADNNNNNSALNEVPSLAKRRDCLGSETRAGQGRLGAWEACGTNARVTVSLAPRPRKCTMPVHLPHGTVLSRLTRAFETLELPRCPAETVVSVYVGRF
jgi:hypothetical protein